VKGYRAYRAGNLQAAEKHWSEFNASLTPGAIWRGDLYRKLGRLEKAKGWYQAGWIHPVAQERLGRLYEKMGKPKKAKAAYERFIAAWKDADPELQDRVEKARERLDALGKNSAE
jgi:tetratricopeptide (TPR) repeat protein